MERKAQQIQEEIAQVDAAIVTLEGLGTVQGVTVSEQQLIG